MDGKKRGKIMLVDDNITNLAIGKTVLQERYDVFTVPSGEKLFMILKRILPDLILLDIEMPEMNGFDVLRRLKASEATRDIPVIFLTARSDADSEAEGLSLGAADFLTKPFSPPLLLRRAEMHLLIASQQRELRNYGDNLPQMIRERIEAVLHLQNTVLQTVTELIECRDDVTGGHIERTQEYLRALVGAMARQGVHYDVARAWYEEEFFFQSSQLHDVGKIAVRDSILMKPAKLTAEEFEEMKKHTVFGGEVIARIEKRAKRESFFRHAKMFALSHHERWDGSGYPLGLRGEEIPLQGRLMAIVDVYDALTSERPYKRPFSHETAVPIIAEGSGAHFDPTLVRVFLSIEDQIRGIQEGA